VQPGLSKKVALMFLFYHKAECTVRLTKYLLEFEDSVHDLVVPVLQCTDELIEDLLELEDPFHGLVVTILQLQCTVTLRPT